MRTSPPASGPATAGGAVRYANGVTPLFVFPSMGFPREIQTFCSDNLLIWATCGITLILSILLLRHMSNDGDRHYRINYIPGKIEISPRDLPSRPAGETYSSDDHAQWVGGGSYSSNTPPPLAGSYESHGRPYQEHDPYVGWVGGTTLGIFEDSIASPRSRPVA